MATTRKRTPRRVATVVAAHRCAGGPWDGHTIYLDAYSDHNSGWLMIAGEVGRYARGKWEPMRAQ
jgi:hypothetical protein